MNQELQVQKETAEERMLEKAKQIVRAKLVKRSDVDGKNVWIVKSSDPNRLDICYIVSFKESEDRFVCTRPYYENRHDVAVCKHILSACFLEGGYK